jgi:hypothetical protein
VTRPYAEPPELFCPILPRINPNAANADAHVTQWMEDNGLFLRPEQVERYAASRFGTFAARVCPDVPLDELLLFARWLAFGFFYDDAFFDEGDSRSRPGAAADAVLAIVSVFSPEGLTEGLPSWEDASGTHRLDVARSLLAETRAMARPEQYDRFCTQMTLWFYSYLYEPAAQAGPDAAAYVVNRLHNIASAPYVTLAEIVTGCPVSADELAAPDLRRLRALAAYQMAWCNDIHSAAREAQVDDRVANLPSLLRGRGLSPRQALLRTVDVHDAAMDAFIRTETVVRPAAPPAVHTYMDLLRTWMRGHYDWCRTTLRYDVSDADAAEGQAVCA